MGIPREPHRKIAAPLLLALLFSACGDTDGGLRAACARELPTLAAAALDDGLVPVDGEVHPLLPDASLSLSDAEFDALSSAIDAVVMALQASDPSGSMLARIDSIEARYARYIVLREGDPKESAYGLRLTAHELIVLSQSSCGVN